MFRGIYELSLDTKGRLSIPTKVRATLEEKSAGKLVLTADLDKNLLIYPLDEWQIAEAKLIQLSSTEPRARMIKQLYLGFASDCELDRTGRILLPTPLRGFAGLEKKVVLSGMGNKLALWSLARWTVIQEENMKTLLSEGFDLTEELSNLSI